MNGFPRRLVRGAFNRSSRCINQGLHFLECSFSDAGERPLDYTPVLIIGAPRSGSTLLYQVITEYYDVGYLSNVHCTFYGWPSLLERLVHPQRWRRPSDYTSRHGMAQGWTAPSECGQFWYRFFRRKPQYVPPEEADSKKLTQLRAAVRALGDAFGKPMVFKNMNCALRLIPTASALPEALFVVIRRNLIDNACSLLETRQRVWGNYSTWWSMEPPEVELLKSLPPHEQVVEQIRHIHALIERDRQIIGLHRFTDIKYKDLCRDVYGFLESFEQFLNRHGVSVRQRGVQVPERFERRSQTRLDPVLCGKVAHYVSGQ